MDDLNHIHMHIPMLLKSIATTCWLLLGTLPQFHCEPPAYNYSVCKEQSYNCGNLSKIFYPLWGQNRAPQCGGGDPFRLKCHDDDGTTSIVIGSQNFIVKEININAQTMRVVRADLALGVCFPQFEDTYMNPTLFPYPPSKYYYNMTIFYDCPYIPHFPPGYNFTCRHALSYFIGDYDGLFDEFPLLQSCKQRLQVRAVALDYDAAGGDHALTEILNEGFEVKYNVSQDCIRCLGSEGNCSSDGINIDEHILSCYYCPDGSHSLHCSSHKINDDQSWEMKVIIGAASAVMGGLCIVFCCFRYKSLTRLVKFCLTTKSYPDIEAFLTNHRAVAQKRYKFSEVKKMTNSFKVKLGQGGFGAVYKGQLPTGFPVAVKLLNASKGNGEEFTNEVASISRTSHVNIVTLLGFCLEGRKKALIYKFMANGSLEKFIYKRGPETIASLSWENLYQISIGIARGLEYLHRGCNTRILHFDIKPHNILLDENFCPKISDFGLAKLCPRKESIISMSDTRGTMGYVAPEMCNRHFGGVSHKSDVYSYGMMLLEMVGGRKNINAEASHTSEIYFPHWAYNKLETLDNDLRPDMVMTTEENEIAKRLAIVGLWCTQTFPNDRPTMSRVIEMLEGSTTFLEIPPKPLLSSPSRSVPESFIP